MATRRDRAAEPNRPLGEIVPSWFAVMGAIFGGFTLIFFMLIVVLSILGKEVPASSRFSLVIVLALSIGLSASSGAGS
jgi:hypothetical protein